MLRGKWIHRDPMKRDRLQDLGESASAPVVWGKDNNLSFFSFTFTRIWGLRSRLVEGRVEKGNTMDKLKPSRREVDYSSSK